MIYNIALIFFVITIMDFNQLIQCGSIPTSCNNSDHDTNAEDENLYRSRFTTTFESFFPLIDNEYWIKARREPAFQENISLSMYRYYMAQHLYARLVQIKSAKGLASSDEKKYANHVQSLAPSVPYGAFTYLSSIGDIEVLEIIDEYEMDFRRFFEYSFIAWPNQAGHFGPIDWDNHFLYMSFPAPVMLVLAIQADLEDGKSFWTLISKYIPDSHYSMLQPTANLLGWKPRALVTTSQRQKLQLSGITGDGFDVINSQFQFNPKLMAMVHSYFKACPQAIVNIKERYKSKKQNFGAMEQLAWLEPEVDTYSLPSKTFAFSEKHVLAVLHPLQTGTEYLNKLSLIMGFRVNKYIYPDDWAIFQWSPNRTIPQDWILTRNRIFEFGDIGEISGTTIPFSYERDGIRTEFLERCYEGQPMYQ
uniref:KatG_1 protein n=2 Tax=Fopius arisanus TaxID=64838 RepID=A0A0C9QZ92_9HYME